MPPFGLLAAGTLLPLFATLPIAVSQQAAPAASDTEVVVLARDNVDRMTVPVSIGAQGPFHFIVDTGAEGRTV